MTEQNQEATTEVTEQSNSAPTEKSVSIPLSQYNEITGKVSKYEADLAYAQREIEKLKDGANSKPQNSQKQEPSRELDELKAQLDSAVAEKDKYANIAKQRIAVDQIFSRVASKFPESTHYFLKQEIAREVDIEGDLEQPKIVVKGPNGQPQWSKQKQNEHMGPEEYAEELLTRHASLSIPHNRGGHRENGTTERAQGGNSNGTYEGLTMNDIEEMTAEQMRQVPPEVLKKILKSNGI